MFLSMEVTSLFKEKKLIMLTHVGNNVLNRQVKENWDIKVSEKIKIEKKSGRKSKQLTKRRKVNGKVKYWKLSVYETKTQIKTKMMSVGRKSFL